MILIVAVDRNWGIGNQGDTLFHISQDIEFFKNITINKAIIMGRKTLDSLPDGKPLKDRVNIVLTNDSNFKRDDVIVCNSLSEVLKEAEKYPETLVIGGGEIYRALLPYCQKAYVTKVDAIKDADSFMVNLDKEQGWKKTNETKDFTQEKYNFRFVVYERV